MLSVFKKVGFNLTEFTRISELRLLQSDLFMSSALVSDDLIPTKLLRIFIGIIIYFSK